MDVVSFLRIVLPAIAALVGLSIALQSHVFAVRAGGLGVALLGSAIVVERLDWVVRSDAVGRGLVTGGIAVLALAVLDAIRPHRPSLRR